MITLTAIEQFLSARTLALAGASRQRGKFGNLAGREAGVDVIHGQCILMHANPGGIHRVHRWLVQLAGRLPAAEA